MMRPSATSSASTDAFNTSASIQSRDCEDDKHHTIVHPSEIVEKFKNANSLKQSDPVQRSKRAKLTDAKKLLHWSKEKWNAFEKIPQFGNPIRCGSFKLIPIRCPLSSIYEIHYTNTKSDYSPSAVMERFIDNAKISTEVINLGLIVDCTSTDALLHETREWEDWDVEYIKLGEKASMEENQRELFIMKSFNDLIEAHEKSKKNELDVAVFELDGYNLVGLLIVSYMVERQNLLLDEAVEAFKKSSPPGITSSRYLTLLYRRYFNLLSSSQARLICPEKPIWDEHVDAALSKDIGPEILTDDDRQKPFIREAKITKNAELSTTAAAPRRQSNSVPTYKPPTYKAPQDPHRSKRRKIRTWKDEVENLNFGETLSFDSAEYKQVRASLDALTNISGFPGCEAIPLTATHISGSAYQDRGCLKRTYLVTWRARGRRALLYLTKEHTYLVSRDMSMTKITMKFPRKRESGEALTDTLIDGVLVEDCDQDTKVLRFLAFDIIFMKGSPVWQMKLEKRLHCLKNEVILPKKCDTSDMSKEPFRIRMKDHFHLTKTAYLLNTFVKTVTHQVDGVIYTPTDAPYNLGGFECGDPIFKFVASENGGCGLPSLDGSITDQRLLEYIGSIPVK